MGRIVQVTDNHMTDPAEIVWDSPDDEGRAIGKYRGIYIMLDERNGAWEPGQKARPGLELDTLNSFVSTVETTLTVTKDGDT